MGIQGGDLLHRAGGAMATKPHVVGYQAAGRVREVGADVRSLTVGQPVVATMGFGSHAELAAVPAAAVYAIPEGLSIDEAAGVPIEFGTADDCLFEFGHLRAGETVLVQAGAGGVGLAAIQLAKAAGAATVFATASSDERLDRLASSASTTASTTPVTTWRRPSASAPTGGASTSSSIRSAARRWRRASGRSRTGAGSAGSAGPGGRRPRRRCGR